MEKKRKVLVADDDYGIRKVLEMVLENAGYYVKSYESGEKILTELESGADYDLILLDVNMSGLNGLELAGIIKEDDKIADIPIIFITGNTESKDKKRGFDAGCVDYIVKPFDKSEILMRVNLHTELAQRRKQMAHYAQELELRVQERTFEINQTKKALIIGISNLAEFRDPETGAHIYRTREFSKMLAVELSKLPKYRKLIDDRFIELMYDCSPLHDIGKVGIPDQVLLKPGKLTDKEYEIMKDHTGIGSRALMSVTSLLKDTSFIAFGAAIAISHHEKYDGTGYPAGLAGDRIPLPGKIMAVSDVYDALSSKRVYKEAWSEEQVKEYIVSQSGLHFDPACVTVLKNGLFKKFREIYDKYKEDE